MITYKRQIPISLITGSTSGGTFFYDVDASGNYYVNLYLSSNFRDLGLYTEINLNDILSGDCFTLTQTQSNNNAIVGTTNVSNGLDNSLLETREAQAYVASPVGSLSGVSSNKLSEITDWGGNLIEKSATNDNGYIFSGTNNITYVIDNIVFNTRKSDGYTTYNIPTNTLNMGVNDLNYEFEKFIIKREKYIDLSEPIRVDDNIFVNRNDESILEQFYRLSEIQKIGNIEDHQNSFFNVYD